MASGHAHLPSALHVMPASPQLASSVHGAPLVTVSTADSPTRRRSSYALSWMSITEFGTFAGMSIW